MKISSLVLLNVVSFLIPVVLVIIWYVQFLSYADICEQGDTGAFFAGTVLRLTVMTTVFGFLLWDHRFNKNSKGARFFILHLICTVLFVAMALTNLPLAESVLIGGYTACGSEYSDPNTATKMDYFMAITYALVPLLLAGLTLFQVVFHISRTKATSAKYLA